MECCKTSQGIAKWFANSTAKPSRTTPSRSPIESNCSRFIADVMLIAAHRSFTPAVLFQLVVQGDTINIEHFGGTRLVPVTFFENSQNVSFFDVFEGLYVANHPISRFQYEILFAQFRFLRHYHGPFYCIFELADVTRPAMLLQTVHRRWRDPGNFLVHLQREFPYKVID